MTFVHVIGWFYVIIASLQFIYIVACALYGAEIEDLHIYKAKPFVQHVKDKQITIVFGCRLSECKLFSNTLKRKAIFPKILDIHKPDAAWRLFRKDYKETINSLGSDPGGTLTLDLQNRNLTLYTTKLRSQKRLQRYKKILITHNPCFIFLSSRRYSGYLL